MHFRHIVTGGMLVGCALLASVYTAQTDKPDHHAASPFPAKTQTNAPSKRSVQRSEPRVVLASTAVPLESFAVNVAETPAASDAAVLPATATKTAITSVDSVRAIQTLQQQISSLLQEKTSQKVMEKTDVGLAVYSITRGKELFSLNASNPLTPASTTKLLPTFSALEQFGMEYLVRTSICTDATEEITGGVLRGNIYLVGRGDPLLSINDLENLAVQLKNMGISRITGNVYGDDTFFDRVTNRQEYSGDDDEVQPTGPISALSVQKNLITVLVSGGNAQKQPVRVQTFPSSDIFTFTVNAVTQVQKPVKTKRRRWVKPSLSIVESGAQANGKQHFVINGTLNPSTTISKLFFIHHPALAATDMLRKRIEMFGITVEGKTGLQKTPNTALVLAEFARPLMEIVKLVNKKSDNFSAEHLFKMLGSPLLASDGSQMMFNADAEYRSAQASLRQIQTVLKDHAIDNTSWTINDGSGLSRRNKIPPATLIRLLVEANRAPFSDAFRNTLAVAGLDGTLEHRMRGTPAEYNVTAKTGTHKNVSALAGYLRTKDGELLAFSFMFNGWGVWHYKGLENKLCQTLAEFSYYTPADSIAAH